MAPLQVIQTLSTNGVATMGMVKAYLSRTLERERKEIANVSLTGIHSNSIICTTINICPIQNHQLIETYRADTATKLDDITRLSTKPETFNATRCSACPNTLDLPTVHFLCKHSFHQDCLNRPAGSSALSIIDGARDEDGVVLECPICAPGNATVLAIRKAQVESAGMHGLFVDELGRSNDRFGTVSEWFGRGVMSSGTQ